METQDGAKSQLSLPQTRSQARTGQVPAGGGGSGQRGEVLYQVFLVTTEPWKDNAESTRLQGERPTGIS